jgi:beta-phosphoglucomutase-like phosphatase (HAD superfamily)
MNELGAVIFDMDGVLLDSERLIRSVVMRISAELGHPIPDDVYLACVGRNARDTRRLLEEHISPAYPHVEVERRVDVEIASFLGDAGWPLRPSVMPALEKLVSRGVRRCVATSTARTRAQGRLQSANILHFFEHVSGGDEVSRGKPAPDLFLLAAERLAVPPAACVVIEDSEYGAQAALDAGMRCVMVPDLKTPPDAIRKRIHGVFDDILLAVQSVVI